MATGVQPGQHTGARSTAKGGAADPKRARLLEAAAEIFAERGYYATTVRDISKRADANIAAVNYHFGDKLGLYTEVLRTNARSVGQDTIRPVLEQAAAPQDVLRKVIHALIQRMCGSGHASLPFRLMRHELMRPTPVLSQVVDEAMRPNYDRMRALVGALLGLPPDHETTRLCVHSIMGQVLFYPLASPLLARLWPQLKLTPQRLDRIADHIADFSVAYLQAARVRS
ncbi:MAG: CerR family C-terminal domain-containing protein [Candidatus Eremiobacteraeota bacterium]|nr:CerR family C-terminal domain-containing protein [Candidatus Eremiobacteraeota bacterium]MBV8367198.1 CerR family C-terminal domain-containing protein [Candidatus Eremiobacteraeota bacterium]